jgi:hypothetical protein
LCLYSYCLGGFINHMRDARLFLACCCRDTLISAKDQLVRIVHAISGELYTCYCHVSFWSDVFAG